MRKLFIVCALMLVLAALVGAVGINGPGVSLPKDTENSVSLVERVSPVSFGVVPFTEHIVLVAAGRTYTEGIVSEAVVPTMRIENHWRVVVDSAACIADIFITLTPDKATLTQEVIPLLGRSEPVESITT
jgi:hypothetical protein